METSTSELSKSAVAHAEAYVRAFNSGDFEAVDRLYDPAAIAVWAGVPATGEQRRTDLRAMLERNPTMTANVDEVYAVEDTALLVVSWSIEVGQERLAGIGLDVLRREPAGDWVFVVDNPNGTAVS